MLSGRFRNDANSCFSSVLASVDGDRVCSPPACLLQFVIHGMILSWPQSSTVSAQCLRQLFGVMLVFIAAFAKADAPSPVENPPLSARSEQRRFKIPKPVVPGFPTPRPDPAKVAIGERLFLETRFSQYFFARSAGSPNAILIEGDPVVNSTVTTNASLRLPGPFAGFAINCRTCHLVNEHFGAGFGNRAYADFARRSPIPERSDGRTHTLRNSPAMVNATIPREGEFFLHYDGEFGSSEDLVKGTLTGRNFGWLPQEQGNALRHIAMVIREDNGRGPLAKEFGGYSYRQLLTGTDPALGEEGERFRLPEELRVDVARATDEQLIDTVARLVTVYMDSLFFSRDERAEYDSSPYDWFLETNQLPRKPDPGQSTRYYNRNLIDTVNGPQPLKFIGPGVTRFKTLKQEFRFGEEELQGMRIFFSLARYSTNSARGPKLNHGIGNCVACHAAPDFTDFNFHNTGATQEEYDDLHGSGAFAKLLIPELEERKANHETWLPATAKHPDARGPFLEIASRDKPGWTDLGLWNVFGNPDHPGVQSTLRELLNAGRKPLSDQLLLPKTIGIFKTPSLRALAFSDPYLHHGGKDTVEDVIEFYMRTSALARAGKLRNADPELAGILLKPEDVTPLAAFLRSLNEDYE